MRPKAAGKRHVARVFDQIPGQQRIAGDLISRSEPKIGRPACLEGRIVAPGMKLADDAVLSLLDDSPGPRQSETMDCVAKGIARLERVLLSLPVENCASNAARERKE